MVSSYSPTWYGSPTRLTIFDARWAISVLLSVFSNRRVNSSPPIRATESLRRLQVFNRWAHRRMTSSPTSWPKRSEEHTSELQSRGHLVCRLLLEKKKRQKQLSVT